MVWNNVVGANKKKWHRTFYKSAVVSRRASHPLENHLEASMPAGFNAARSAYMEYSACRNFCSKSGQDWIWKCTGQLWKIVSSLCKQVLQNEAFRSNVLPIASGNAAAVQVIWDYVIVAWYLFCRCLQPLDGLVMVWNNVVGANKKWHRTFYKSAVVSRRASHPLENHLEASMPAGFNAARSAYMEYSACRNFCSKSGQDWIWKCTGQLWKLVSSLCKQVLQNEAFRSNVLPIASGNAAAVQVIWDYVIVAWYLFCRCLQPLDGLVMVWNNVVGANKKKWHRTFYKSAVVSRRASHPLENHLEASMPAGFNAARSAYMEYSACRNFCSKSGQDWIWKCTGQLWKIVSLLCQQVLQNWAVRLNLLRIASGNATNSYTICIPCCRFVCCPTAVGGVLGSHQHTAVHLVCFLQV